MSLTSVRTLFRSVAFACALGPLAYWAALGAHRGWSQHRVPVQQHDEITGITYITYEDRFVPGVEIPGAGLVLAGAFAAVSFFFRPTASTRPKS